MTPLSKGILFAAIVSLFLLLMDSIRFPSEWIKYLIDVVFILVLLKLDPLKFNGSSIEKHIIIMSKEVSARLLVVILVAVAHLSGYWVFELSNPFPFAMVTTFICYWIFTKLFETR